MIGFLIWLDLGILRHKATDLSLLEALALAIFWISLGLSFALVVYLLYAPHGLGRALQTGIDSRTAVTHYITAYLVEESLSLDNLFVIALILQSLRIPLQFQQRVLMWGIVGAIIMRGIIIVLGVYLVQHFTWMNYIFGSILLFSAIKLLRDSQQPEIHPTQGAMTRFVQRFIALSPDTGSGKFFIRQGNAWFITPLFIAVLMVETADLLFAVDSIPAVLGISSDSFIIFSSNIFAILGLRALYFVLAAAIQQLRYLNVTLVVILGFIGVKMLLSEHFVIGAGASLLIICTLLILGITSSVLHKPALQDNSPLVARGGYATPGLSVASLRRALILLWCSSVIVIGVIMALVPGPAVVVIPAGGMLLIAGWIVAHRLLKQFKEKSASHEKS